MNNWLGGILKAVVVTHFKTISHSSPWRDEVNHERGRTDPVKYEEIQRPWNLKLDVGLPEIFWFLNQGFGSLKWTIPSARRNQLILDRSHKFCVHLKSPRREASRPGRITAKKITPRKHWIGGWVGCRADLDVAEQRKFSYPCHESNPSRPVRSPSLYELKYPWVFTTHISQVQWTFKARVLQIRFPAQLLRNGGI
jgi:hypothetical protein